MDTWPADARIFSRPSHLQGKSPGNEVGDGACLFMVFNFLDLIADLASLLVYDFVYFYRPILKLFATLIRTTYSPYL